MQRIARFIRRHSVRESDENKKLLDQKKNTDNKTQETAKKVINIEEPHLTTSNSDKQHKEETNKCYSKSQHRIQRGLESSEFTAFQPYVSSDDENEKSSEFANRNSYTRIYKSIELKREGAIDVKGNYLHANKVKLSDRQFILAQKPIKDVNEIKAEDTLKVPTFGLFLRAVAQENGFIVDFPEGKESAFRDNYSEEKRLNWESNNGCVNNQYSMRMHTLTLGETEHKIIRVTIKCLEKNMDMETLHQVANLPNYYKKAEMDLKYSLEGKVPFVTGGSGVGRNCVLAVAFVLNDLYQNGSLKSDSLSKLKDEVIEQRGPSCFVEKYQQDMLNNYFDYLQNLKK